MSEINPTPPEIWIPNERVEIRQGFEGRVALATKYIRADLFSQELERATVEEYDCAIHSICRAIQDAQKDKHHDSDIDLARKIYACLEINGLIIVEVK